MDDVIVIGAGPAGLATSAALTQAGMAHRVLERGDTVGYTWAQIYYESLVLHTARRLSALPGLAFPRSTPQFPTRRDLVDYLHRYADTFRVPLELRADVTEVSRDGGVWSVRTGAGVDRRAGAVVVATGIAANPYEPAIAGRDCFRGVVLHSVRYQRPAEFVRRRVLVVGAGNSAGEIAVELADAGAQVTLAVRSGATVLPRDIAGVPVHYLGVALGVLPASAQQIAARAMGRVTSLLRVRPVLRPAPVGGCPRMPLIGLRLADALRCGSIGLKHAIIQFTEDGMRFDDGTELPFDAVILATGFRAAVGMLGSLIQVDHCGFARRRDRVASSDQPGVYFVGHNYGIQGALYNIGRDARLVARHISGA